MRHDVVLLAREWREIDAVPEFIVLAIDQK